MNCDDNCIDLPSLTEIHCEKKGVFKYIGHVIVESTF